MFDSTHPWKRLYGTAKKENGKSQCKSLPRKSQSLSSITLSLPTFSSVLLVSHAFPRLSGFYVDFCLIPHVTGQLNVPSYPEIDGSSTFSGKMMHSARWDWSYELAGKRIALIGNGATAAQIAPEITKVADSVTVFQRTPNWIIPRGDCPIGEMRRAVYRNLPFIQHWRRQGMME